MSETESDRGQGGAYPTETDSRRPSPTDGEPPRPSTEPKGSEGSSRPDPDRESTPGVAREIATDPATGEPVKPS